MSLHTSPPEIARIGKGPLAFARPTLHLIPVSTRCCGPSADGITSAARRAAGIRGTARSAAGRNASDPVHSRRNRARATCPLEQPVMTSEGRFLLQELSDYSLARP